MAQNIPCFCTFLAPFSYPLPQGLLSSLRTYTHIPIHITIREWQWGTGIHMWERIWKTFFSLGWNVFSRSYIALVTRVNVEMTKHHLPLQTLWQLAKTQVNARKTMCWSGFLFRFPSPSCLCSCLLKVPSSLFRQRQPVSSNLHPIKGNSQEACWFIEHKGMTIFLLSYRYIKRQCQTEHFF